MNVMHPERIVESIEEMLGDPEIACEYSERRFCSKQPARWIALVRGHDCTSSLDRLVCDGCKELILATDMTFECRGCNMLTTPARHAFSRVEALTW